MTFVKDGEFSKERITAHIEKTSHLELAVSPSGLFQVNGFDIPYEHQGWFFKTFSDKVTVSAKTLFGHDVVRSTLYTLTIDDHDYTLEVLDKAGWEPTVSYMVDGKLHCDTGPAYKTETSERYYSHGHLHNASGPAIRRTSGSDIFALHGNIYDRIDYIRKNPRSKLIDSEYEFRVLDESALISKGGHSFVVSASTEDRPEDFILSAVTADMPYFGFSKIDEYQAPSAKLDALYKECKNFTDKTWYVHNDVFYGVGAGYKIGVKYNEYNQTFEITRLYFDKEDGPREEKEVVNLFPESHLPRSTINLLKKDNDLPDGSVYKQKKLAKKEKRRKIDRMVGDIIRANSYSNTRKIIKSWDYKHQDSIIDAAGIELAMPADFKLLEPDDILNSPMEDNSIKVYGVSIPQDIFLDAKYNSYSNSYYWENDLGETHSPGENLPAIISPNGKMLFFKNGFLHRESGPAVQGIYDRKQDEWYLWNRQVSSSEVEHTTKSDFKIGANRMATSQVKYTELHADEVEHLKQIFRDNIEHLRKYKDDIQKASEKALLNKGIKVEKTKPKPIPVPEKKEKIAEDRPMNIETTKKVRSAPDLTGTRTEQLVNGFKFGFKKGVVNNSSHLLAEKVASLTPYENNEWFERFLQICFLLGAAEAMERMPEGMGEKMRMDDEFRLNAASMCRYISGENLGRDLVDIAENVLPLIIQVVQNLSAEELNDLAQDFGEEASADSEEESLFEGLAVEEEVEEKSYEKVMA